MTAPIARRQPGRSPARRCSPPGFSIVEVLVALIVVAVGLLGVAGASAIALRASSAAMRERSAVTRARSRLALLQAMGCVTAADGMQQWSNGLGDRWTIGAEVSGARMVEVSAEWDDTGRRRAVTLRSALLC